MLDLPIPPQTSLRPPSEVMRLRRMGAAFPTRLSFLPTLLRHMAAERVRIDRPVWNIDARGFGHALYTLRLAGHAYGLVAVSSDLPPEARTDRVIATAWDTAHVLTDGIPDAAELARIVAAAPRQEAARFTARDLILSRANKSVRLFDHVTARLAAGGQPDPGLVRATGYLMRTTAVYGNGKFGIADRSRIADRPVLSGPFMAEMLTVWLIRHFTHDLAEHVGGARLDPRLKRHLGIGNATGLGMAPFLVAHPLLLDAWMQVRETALARVRAVEALEADRIDRLHTLVARAAAHLAEWQVDDPTAAARLDMLRREWPEVAAHLSPEALARPRPLDRLMSGATRWSIDTQELLAALLIEPFGDLVDGLTECMASPFAPRLDPAMSCEALAALIAQDWDWALALDFAQRRHSARFWYVSEEKAEPRLGDRFTEDGAERESPLDIARQVQALARDLAGQRGPLSRFLALHPNHRAAARRVQTLARHPYAEIRDNMIGAECLPIDMLRCKLAFFGAAKFDPKSDRWTRIALAQGAPLGPDPDSAQDWWLAAMDP
ncbi:MAG: hypothetical protein JJT81_11960 [Rubellimicrobium sp.]|nr:hypothetical protein [Rubellimicrobium sp.]